MFTGCGLSASPPSDKWTSVLTQWKKSDEVSEG
jgi:hypothetical protein